MIRNLKWYLVFSICLAGMLLTACGTLQVGLERKSTPDSRLQNTMVAMETANARLATLIVTPTQTLAPTSPASPFPSITPSNPPAEKSLTLTPPASPTPGPPRFSSLYFSIQPDGPPQRFFGEYIQRVYAVWNYENMQMGMVVHRVWEKDDKLWAERYETWDMEKYGSDGTRRDIHIFDLDYGLEPAKYSLTLDIDGVVQEFPQGDSTNPKVDFQVVASEVGKGGIPSPNRAYSIFISWGGRISIKDPDGNLRDVVVTNEVAAVAWFPDNRHIIYVDRDRSGQESLDSDLGITHQMWILDVISGERHQIGSTEENYHHPLISPEGRYAAVLSGNTFQDACQASPRLAVLEFDDNFQKKAEYPLSRFSGWPAGETNDMNLTPNNPNRAGYWEDEHTFITSVSWICPENSNQIDGLYLLNMENLQVEHLQE